MSLRGNEIEIAHRCAKKALVTTPKRSLGIVKGEIALQQCPAHRMGP